MNLNINSITEPLRVIDSENVLFNFNINESKGSNEVNITKAIIIKSDKDCDYIHVVMPLTF